MDQPLPVLTGRRVLLREPRAEDAGAVFRQVADPEVTRFLAFETPVGVDDTLAFIARCVEYRRQDREYVFVVADVRHDEPVGVTGLRHIEMPMRTAQIGTWLARGHWGTGVNAEAKRLLLDFAFGALGLHRVEARIALDNVRSRRAFEKLGAVQEGILRQSFYKNGRFYDQELYAILAPEWRRRMAAKHP
jgi:ribosomal-protein-alanine N-acetyltransferase